jgi:hypothetical protein
MMCSVASAVAFGVERLVPIWSSVEVTTPQEEADAALETLRKTSEQIDLRERVAFLQRSVVALLEKEKIAEAYEATRQALPDARIFIEPFITPHCNAEPMFTQHSGPHLMTGNLVRGPRIARRSRKRDRGSLRPYSRDWCTVVRCQHPKQSRRRPPKAHHPPPPIRAILHRILASSRRTGFYSKLPELPRGEECRYLMPAIPVTNELP